MHDHTEERRSERGVALLVVLVFALLLASSVAVFAKRATIDSMITHNREKAARAEALARGGIQLATALILEDLLEEQDTGGGERIDSHLDRWARIGQADIPAGDGARLRLRVEDAGARLNLHAALGLDANGAPAPQAHDYLTRVLEKVIDELDIPPGERALYDPAELADHLIDYVDTDESGRDGPSEDAYYQQQDPPYRAANRPLLSLDELGLVEGFDTVLVEGLRPYLTVFPYSGRSGVNPNTAPSYVLALVYLDDAGQQQLAQEDDVRGVLKLREKGHIYCPTSSQSSDLCEPIQEFQGVNEPYPPLTFSSDVFTAVAEAQVGEVRRVVTAVIDRSEPTQPRLLSWRVR